MMNKISDKEGHSVKVLGMCGLMFIDNNKKKYFIDSEVLLGNPYDIVISVDSIRYYDDSDATPISEEKKKQIVSIILKLFESKNKYVDVR